MSNESSIEDNATVVEQVLEIPEDNATVVEQVIEIPVSEVPESEISVEVSSDPLYCICQEPWDIHNRKFMIHCDHCSDWFHGSCIDLSEIEARRIEKYHCPKCIPLVGPSISVNVGARTTAKKARSVRCTPEFIAKLKEYKFNIPDEVVLRVRGQALTLPWLISRGFVRPILVESTEGLDMKLPADTFTVNDVERYVGSERMVDVIDVERQTDVLMSMKDFTEYFTSPNRAKLLNLISLEFTHTNLNKLVEAPSIARKLDFVSNYWPVNSNSVDDEINQRPTVSKYCLISAKDSYTDFHIDFGGTSVWYHVLWGEKVFYLIEPSDTNINLYHRWMNGEMGDECFLADEVPVCFRCVLKKGQTLLIPTGWIHAVYTPQDSLVFGGNFLHFLNMDLQLQIYDMEKVLQTPSKYLFPSFEATHWFAAEGLAQDLHSLNASAFVPAYLCRGLRALIHTLRIWVSERDTGRTRREIIPAKLNCKKIIRVIGIELRTAEKRMLANPSHREYLPKDTVSTDKSVKSKETVRRESIAPRNEPSETTSKESSDKTAEIGPANTDCLSPRQNNTNLPAPIKLTLKLKQQPVVEQTQVSVTVPSQSSSTCSSPSAIIKTKKKMLVLRSVPDLKKVINKRVMPDSKTHEDKAEYMDINSNDGSDSLYIDTDSEVVSQEDSTRQSSKKSHSIKSHKKHHRKRCSRKKTSKPRNDRDHNKSINDVLAGTLDGIEELFKSSNYSERISQCENTSQAIKDTVAGMDAMKDTILPLKKRTKHKKSKANDNSRSNDSDDGIDKVHQDDDYIYLPLVDDEPQPSEKKNRGRKKEDDESWSPRMKVGPVGNRDIKYSRVNAKKRSVEMGLEKASETLEYSAKLKRKQQDDLPLETKKVKKLKLVPSKPSSASSPIKWNVKKSTPVKKPPAATVTVNTPSRKPKKGMATPKQRLGKILKISKFTRF